MEAEPHRRLERTFGHGDPFSPTSLSSRSWVSSSNWEEAFGSLDESIVFEVSSGDDNELAESLATLLLKPEIACGDAPCEITVRFREKMDIHKIYLQSTSRVFEVYYSTDEPTISNEYLHTIKCSSKPTEVVLPEEFYDYFSNENQRHTSQTSNAPENYSRSSSDVDGWVEVNHHESTSKVIRGRHVQPVQVLHAAAAVITDLTPCSSITLRLLSLQNKESVYISDIYICADPVFSAPTSPVSSINSGDNAARSSLMARFFPGLLQLQNNYNSYPVENTYTNRPALQCQNNYNSMPVSGNYHPYVPVDVSETSHVEKVFDDLLSRVGKMEKFCLRFEEKLVKPLSSIETRLNRMEQKLDVLTAKSYHHETLLHSISTSEIACHDESDSGNIKESKLAEAPKIQRNPIQVALYPSTYISKPYPVHKIFVLTEPEFPRDDNSHINCNSTLQSSSKNCSEIPEVLGKESESSLVDDCSQHNNTSASTEKMSSPVFKPPFSIDTALNSALQAFVMSSGSSEHEHHFEDENKDNPSGSAISSGVLGEGPGSSNHVSFEGDNMKIEHGVDYDEQTEQTEPNEDGFLLQGRNKTQALPKEWFEGGSKESPSSVDSTKIEDGVRNNDVYNHLVRNQLNEERVSCAEDFVLSSGNETQMLTKEQFQDSDKEFSPIVGVTKIEDGVCNNDECVYDYLENCRRSLPLFGRRIQDRGRELLNVVEDLDVNNYPTNFTYDSSKYSTSSNQLKEERASYEDDVNLATCNRSLKLFGKMIQDRGRECLNVDEDPSVNNYPTNFTDDRNSKYSKDMSFSLKYQHEGGMLNVDRTAIIGLNKDSNPKLCNSGQANTEIIMQTLKPLIDHERNLDLGLGCTACGQTSGRSYLEVLLGDDSVVEDTVFGCSSEHKNSFLEHDVDANPNTSSSTFMNHLLVDVGDSSLTMKSSTAEHEKEDEEDTTTIMPSWNMWLSSCLYAPNLNEEVTPQLL